MKTVSMSTNKKNRNESIDVLKFLAAVLITNSHMASLYPVPFTQLATGGAIGDALFFFASGFTISYSRGGNFFNWYKRRVNRIFPTIFAVAVFDIVLFGLNPTLKDTVIGCGGWFIQCIFLFYAVFWFVKRYLMNKLWVAYVINANIAIVWYIFFWDYDVFILYNGTYLRWSLYFFAMLLGASIARKEKKSEVEKVTPLGWLLLIIVALLVFYYGYQIIEKKYVFLEYGQLILVPVLLGIIYCIYLFCKMMPIWNFYSHRVSHMLIYWISTMCLEVYLCQHWIIPTGASFIKYFPINVLISFVAIFITAYLLKIVSNFLSQTFKSEDYDWGSMITL